jgi:hypothetical protein
MPSTRLRKTDAIMMAEAIVMDRFREPGLADSEFMEAGSRYQGVSRAQPACAAARRQKNNQEPVTSLGGTRSASPHLWPGRGPDFSHLA